MLSVPSGRIPWSKTFLFLRNVPSACSVLLANRLFELETSSYFLSSGSCWNFRGKINYHHREHREKREKALCVLGDLCGDFTLEIYEENSSKSLGVIGIDFSRNSCFLSYLSYSSCKKIKKS